MIMDMLIKGCVIISLTLTFMNLLKLSGFEGSFEGRMTQGSEIKMWGNAVCFL